MVMPGVPLVMCTELGRKRTTGRDRTEKRAKPPAEARRSERSKRSTTEKDWRRRHLHAAAAACGDRLRCARQDGNAATSGGTEKEPQISLR